jgi:hypothetical protein
MGKTRAQRESNVANECGKSGVFNFGIWGSLVLPADAESTDATILLQASTARVLQQTEYEDYIKYAHGTGYLVFRHIVQDVFGCVLYPFWAGYLVVPADPAKSTPPHMLDKVLLRILRRHRQ